MKHPRFFALLLSAILLFSLFAGCADNPAATETSTSASEEKAPLTETDKTAPETAETLTAAKETVPETTEAPDAPDVPVRWQNGGKMSFLPQEPLTIPNLSDMPYSRPDTESLFAAYDALTAKAADCSDAELLLADYYALLPDRQSFEAMYGIAYFRYCMDTSVDYYFDEYDFCEAQFTVLDEKESALFAAFAASPCRESLEQAYFGAGFFEDYDDFQTGGEEYLRLTAEENALLRQYLETEASWDWDRSTKAQYHDAMSSIFVELVKLRQQIAVTKGYENYSDYRYAVFFHRDYTPAQAQAYLRLVREQLVPLVKSMAQNPTLTNATYPFVAKSQEITQLSETVEQLGDPILEAFRFMEGHQLYDNSDSSSKYPTSYQTYLPSYEAPILFTAYGDFDTLIHEFGHFVDSYCNYGDDMGQDIAEIYSTGMEFLATAYNPAFDETKRERGLRVILRDLMMYTIIRQAAFADFELQVYTLAPEEITVDKIDSIYVQCAKDYAFQEAYALDKMHWVDIQHFFLYPSYVVSYSTAGMASMQVCRLEAEQAGAGVEAYCRLLNRTHHRKFSFVLNEAGLDSPFEESTMQKTVDFLKSFLELP